MVSGTLLCPLSCCKKDSKSSRSLSPEVAPSGLFPVTLLRHFQVYLDFSDSLEPDDPQIWCFPVWSQSQDVLGFC